MNNALRILDALDSNLDKPVELTLYGRAALSLGFAHPPDDFAKSHDIDAVLWLGQAEELNEKTNFWETVDKVNRELADQELYISHFFTEDQVVLLPDWRKNRVKIDGSWEHLRLYRLGDLDLLLSKLMRLDPLDQADALFIASHSRLSRSDISTAISRARVPDALEVREQFRLSAEKLLNSL